MPLERKRADDEEPGGGSGLHVDLDDLVCTSCRRDLPSWMSTCPDCGGAAVPRAELPPAHDPLLARFLDDDEDGATDERDAPS